MIIEKLSETFDATDTGGFTMRKGLTIIALIIGTVVFTAACSLSSIRTTEKSNKPETLATTFATEAVPSKETTEPSSKATPTPTVTPTPTSTPTPTPTPAHDDALWALLTRLANFPSGSSGSSFKKAALCAELLDWAEDTAFTQDEIEADITAFSESLGSDDERKLFFENYTNESIRDMAEDLIAGDAGALGALETSGYVLQHASFTVAKWESFDFAFCTAYDKYLEAYPAP
jgi:hypothetical protein